MRYVRFKGRERGGDYVIFRGQLSGHFVRALLESQEVFRSDLNPGPQVRDTVWLPVEHLI